MKKLIISMAFIASLSTVAVAQTSESFGGFGISIHPGKKGASVASVLSNSPAAQAGLLAGDVIISVNGTLLSSVALENQISLLRGKPGSSVTLQVSRGGESIIFLVKRVTISVQDLKSKDISDWFGNSKNLNLEELNYLASQKICENCELLGIVQNGLPVDTDMENLNLRQIQHVSLKKETTKEDDFASPAKDPANLLNFRNYGTISISLANAVGQARILIFNAKGVTVWQKSLGKLPAGVSSIDWGGTNLPAGSYYARLEAGSAVFTQRFELR